MNTKYELPMMMSAKDLQSMGFSRSMAYCLLQGDLIPVVCIGKRRLIRHETLLKWLAEHEQTNKSESPTDLKHEEVTAPDEDDRFLSLCKKRIYCDIMCDHSPLLKPT